jgi:hypothetical protein
MNVLNIPVPNDIAQWPLGQYYDFFMDWRVPVVTGAVYFVTVHILNPHAGEKRPDYLTSSVAKLAVIAHSWLTWNSGRWEKKTPTPRLENQRR